MGSGGGNLPGSLKAPGKRGSARKARTPAESARVHRAGQRREQRVYGRPAPGMEVGGHPPAAARTIMRGVRPENSVLVIVQRLPFGRRSCFKTRPIIVLDHHPT